MTEREYLAREAIQKIVDELKEYLQALEKDNIAEVKMEMEQLIAKHEAQDGQGN